MRLRRRLPIFIGLFVVVAAIAGLFLSAEACPPEPPAYCRVLMVSRTSICNG
jgi:hypothetical protein